MPDSIRGDAEGHPHQALWSFDLGGGIFPWVGSVPPDIRRLRRARSIPSRSGAGHVPTWAYSTTVGQHVRLESGLEHDLFRDLDRDRAVTWLLAQPARIRSRTESKGPGAVPDLLSMTGEGEVTVWAVRPEPKQDEAFGEQVIVAEAACADFGWKHRVFAGMSTTRRTNLMWLDGYRNDMPWYQHAIEALLAEVGDVCTLAFIQEMDGGAGHIMSAVWHAIRQGEIECHLDSPFTGSSELRFTSAEARG